MKKAVAYIRVSQKDENPENQLLAIRKWAKENGFEIVNEFIDYDVSGIIPPRERLAYSQMIKFCKQHNIKNIIFYDLSRLSRNLIEGLKEIERLLAEGFDIYTLDKTFELLNTLPYQSLKKIVLALLLGFAELYREDIVRRTKEGLERAKAQGKKLGRPLKLNDEQNFNVKKKLREQGYSYNKIAKILGVSKATVINYAKRLNLK